MISSLDPQSQQFLTNLNRTSARMNRAQLQISSGSRLNQVSDDPDQVPALLTARAHLLAAQQTVSNLGRVKGEVDGAEQALESAVELFERARSLGAEGASSLTQTAQSRANLAQEVGSILEQLVGTAGTSVEGRFVFAGDSDQAPPFTVDLTLDPPVSTYLGSAATRQALHPNGSTFATSLSGQDIFDSTDPATSVFGTVKALRDALLANDDAGIKTALDGLTPAGNYLNGQLAFYGTTQNKIADALDFGQSLQVQLKTQIAGIQDTDLSQAILDLNQAELQQQASLESRARIPRTTLFDFLG